MKNEDQILVLEYPDGTELRFDYIMKSANGFIAGIILKLVGIDQTIDKDDLIKINKGYLHQVCGHQHEGNLKGTAEHLGYCLVWKMEKCVHCTKGKARKTKLGKEVQEEVCKVGERIGKDISGSKEVSLGGKRYAQVKLDCGSYKLFVSFLKKKSEGVSDMMKFLKKVLKERKKLPKFIRMDRSGENMKFKEV